MVDYVRDARWGRVMESCGEDPLLNGIMGAAQVKAYQGDNLKNPSSIASCVKHFAAYGGAEAGRDYNDVELSERVLREYSDHLRRDTPSARTHAGSRRRAGGNRRSRGCRTQRKADPRARFPPRRRAEDAVRSAAAHFPLFHYQ